jgi:PAS domain S-box-containing protein
VASPAGTDLSRPDVLNSIRQAIAAFDGEWRYTFVNEHTEMLCRIPKEQLLGRVIWEVFPNLLASPFFECCQTAMRHRVHGQCAGYYEPCDLWAEVDVWPAPDGCVVVIRDVSAVGQTDDKIRQLTSDLARQVKQFETLIEVLPVGIGVASDPECRDIRVNPAFASLLNYDGDRNASKTPNALLPFRLSSAGIELPADQLPMQVAAREVRAIDELELQIQRSDGSFLTELCFARPLFDEHHNVSGSLGVFLDITERKRAEQALRESEARYRFLAEGIPQIVWIATTENQVIYINGHWCSYTGLSLEETQKDGWAGVIHPDDFARAVDPVLASRAGNGEYEAEYRLHRASDGSYRWHFARARLVRMEDGSERWLGTAVDIDDRKRGEEERVQRLAREQELRRQSEEALEVQRQIEERLLLLVEASSALIASPESSQVLKTILDLSRRFVQADAYAVWREGPDRIQWGILASEGLSDAYTHTLTQQVGGTRAVPDHPFPIEDVEQAPLVRHRLELYRAEGIRSMLTVPLRIDGQMGGTIVFYYRSPHHFTELETRVAGGLSNLAAAALGASELYQRQTVLRKLAESAEHRAEFLSEAGKVLSSSLDYEATLAAVAEMAVPDIADWAAVDMLDPSGGLRRLAVKHVDPEKIALAHEYDRRYPPDERSAVRQALRTGKSFLVEEISEAMLQQRIQDAEQLRFLKDLGLTSVIVVPLMANGRALGALTFVAAGAFRRFSKIDLALAEELASRAATAVTNAHLYTASRHAEAALQSANTELQRANSDLNQFTYSASHDLREPLRMVSIFSQMLARNCENLLDEEARQCIRYISQGANRMEELVEDILSFTHSAEISGEVTTPASVSAALSSAMLSLDAIIQETEAVIRSAPLPLVRVQELHLSQVFENLIGNALKYRSKQAPVIDVRAARRGEYWMITVEDNAIGIAPEYWNQIFGLFKRLHTADQYPGTGIGLAICQKIVERYGGRIWVDSEPGKGSVFSFTLPAADDSAAE